MSAFDIYDELTVKDIQQAADLLKPVYEVTGRKDGYVSLEINPELSRNTEETIREGRRLCSKVNRPNVMFKVPATDEGLAAVEEFVAEGININVTLIFSLDQYVRAAQRYIKGLTRFSAKRGKLAQVHSVASVFVSRIDTMVDAMLDQAHSRLKGKAAVAHMHTIYHTYREILSSVEFKTLAEKGASIQRVLWASTGTKNPAYSDIKYVSELIAPDTVNTLPEKTLKNFLDHGAVRDAGLNDIAAAQKDLQYLHSAGINIDEVCRTLLAKGLEAFEKSFTSLLESIKKKSSVARV